MVIDAHTLERAVRRHWFRYPADDGKPWGKLDRRTREKILDEAMRMQEEISHEQPVSR